MNQGGDDLDITPSGLDPVMEGQAPPVRPAAPVPSPRGGDGRRAPDSNESSDGEGMHQVRQHIVPSGLYRQAYDDNRRTSSVGDWGFAEMRGTLSKRDDIPQHITDECTRDGLPPPADHEIEFIVKDALTYTAGQPTRSHSKTVGNFRFRLLVFPSGTHSTGGAQVSAFVEADPVEGLDPRWIFHSVKYQITVINWNNYRSSTTKSDTWTFQKDGIDRGWHDMVRTADLSQESGWLGKDNSLCLRASCYVRQADSINVSNDYNFRKETGFIGLKNHGATCYMNGLLQSLFHVGEFRRIVYCIDCDDTPDSPGKDDPDVDPTKIDSGENDGKAPPLIQALQNVFYKLQTSDQAVNCRELMKSFGWDTMDAFTQHDAQELNRILCDRLEEQMKGTPMDGSIKRLFEGEMENYIECIDVDYKSRRNETFYDIQLNIKGERGQELRTIEESLRDFTAEETLEGDNAYEAEGHGKQRARKGIRFLTFPPVLNLQLKRFHFDLEKLDMVKLNSTFQFNRRLDLSPFAPGAGTYALHAVVVHSGDVNSGHYYAHIRPTMDSSWFKFDDDTVTPCSDYAAVEDNFGGSDLTVWNYFDRTPRELYHQTTPTRARIHNAYMLVYIREDMAAEVLKVPDPKEVNLKMVERCDQEGRLAEQRRREKIEQQTKIKIKLVFERDLCKMTGFWDHAEISCDHVMKMGRDQSVKDLCAEVESLTEVPKANLVLFNLHYRSNPRQVRFAFMQLPSTFRSHIPQYTAPHFDTGDPFLTVLCVASRGYDIQTLKWRPKDDKKPDALGTWHDENVVLLIVKYFCPTLRRIVTLGCYYASNNEPIMSMVTDGWVADRLAKYVDNKEVAPLPEDQDNFTWECWEEFSERDMQPRTVKRSVKNEQLWSGDVLIWQPSREPLNSEVPEPNPTEGDDDVAPSYQVNNVADFATHLANSIEVSVTLHDARQPLCVDGIVSNGVWGPPRPASAVQRDPKQTAQREERPEDRPEDLTLQALSASPAAFRMPEEKDIRMDLRWHLRHVTGTISRAFGLRAHAAEGVPHPSSLWLFQGAPSSTADVYLEAPPSTTLKELQRGTMFVTQPSKKPLVLHAVEVPLQTMREVLDRNLMPMCIRFFDDAVREVGSEIILLNAVGSVYADVIDQAQRLVQQRGEWGMTGPLRCLEVSEARLSKICDPKSFLVRGQSSLAKSNIFYHSLRIEADPDSGSITERRKLVEIFHCDRQSQCAFAQPMLLLVELGEKSGSIKTRCKNKLRVPDTEFRSWRLVRCGRGGRTHLKDDEPWDAADPTMQADSRASQLWDVKLCLEHVHPCPTNSLARQSRYNKPLTIK